MHTNALEPSERQRQATATLAPQTRFLVGGVPLPGEGEGARGNSSVIVTQALLALEELSRQAYRNTALSWRFVANRATCQQIRFFALRRMRDAAMAWRGKL